MQAPFDPSASHDEARLTDDSSFSAEQEREINDYRVSRAQGRGVKSQRPSPLNRFAVFCIIANRMIGSGIFLSPELVLRDTGSLGAAILLWVVGAIITLAGTHVFVEFGQAIPQIPVDLQLVSVPANGGEKNYLEYVVQRPKRLITCLYGIPFILLGNMAGNTILFGQSIYVAITDQQPSGGTVRGIAAGVATLACFLHVYSRQLGILVNNTFGLTKAALLLALIVIAIISLAGGLPDKTIQDAKHNYADHALFVTPPQGSSGYASSFLAIVFAYGGFNQANYVMGNISQPRRTFKWTALLSVAFISACYITLSLCFYAIVPFNQLSDPNTTLLYTFIARTLSPSQFRRIASAFIAFSSLGNIIIQTFTASRVKQELAKEGVLPKSKFFAANRNWHWRFWYHPPAEEITGKATPFGALLLHWAFCMVFIFGSFPLDANTAYRVYVSIYTFTIDAIFGCCVGASILYLRIADMVKTNPTWRHISSENKWMSMGTALIYTVANLYPLIDIWFPPPKGDQQAAGASFPYWITGTVGWSTVAAGGVWWLGLKYVYPWFVEEDLKVERKYFTAIENGERVVVNEVVYIWWRSKARPQEIASPSYTEIALK